MKVVTVLNTHVQDTHKKKRFREVGKQTAYIFRQGMINKMFFFIDIKNEST